VTYDGASRTARLAPSARLKASALYRVEAGAAIKDAGGNALAATTATFTTGTTSFIDTAGTAFEVEIEWLYGTGITEGCTAEAFCPRAAVKREEAAAFVARALGAPTTTSDFFTDDEGSALEPEINRLAAMGVTRGCASTLFCPAASMTRAQMASFLARALGLPATTSDFFADDEFSAHEDAINQLAAAGMVNGCQPGSYCPDGIVTREQMAAFLYRAFGPGS
jgi:hypothetical protein